jgi:hypothetical protein
MNEAIEDQVKRAFREQVKEIDAAQDLYRALCNMRWQRVDAPDQIMDYSWRMAGDLVADLRNEIFAGQEIDRNVCRYCGQPSGRHRFQRQRIEVFGKPVTVDKYLCRDGQHIFQEDRRGSEDYLDFYCSGDEGHVAEWVEEEMLRIGLRPRPWPGD